MYPHTPRVNDFQFPHGLRLETGQIGSQDKWPAAGSSGVDGSAGASGGLQQNCYRREAGGTGGRSGEGDPDGQNQARGSHRANGQRGLREEPPEPAMRGWLSGVFDLSRDAATRTVRT